MSETTTHLYRSIHAQPQAIRDLLADGAGPQHIAQLLATRKRVFLAGIGTSFHAASIGEYLLRLAGIEAWAVRSFEFISYPRQLQADDAVIIISHRGSKQYSAMTIQRANEVQALTIGITGKNSSMQGAQVILETVDQDLSSTHTISYTTTLIRLAQIAAALARITGKQAQAHELEEGLACLPAFIEDILQREQVIRPIAQEAVANQRRIYFVGAGPNAVTAWEGALKAKEASYVTAEGFELEQAIHGPLVAFEKNDLIIPLSIQGGGQTRMHDLLLALRDLGCQTWLLTDAASKENSFQQASWTQFTLYNGPALPEALTPVVAVLPLQLLADFLAAARGINADSFRRDDPLYAQALDHIHL